MFANTAANLLTLLLAGQPAGPTADVLQQRWCEQVPMAPLTLHVAKPISGDAATADSENVPSWKKLFDPNCWKSKRKQEQKPEDRKHFLFSLLRRSEEQPSDQMLTSRCRGLLFTDEELSSSAVSVQAQNGVIILQGTVSSAELKERAGRMAGQTAGVKDVRNELQVVGLEEQWFRQNSVTLAAPQQTQVRRVTEPGVYTLQPARQTTSPATEPHRAAEPALSSARTPSVAQSDVTSAQRPPVVVLGTPRWIQSAPDLPLVKTYQIRRSDALQVAAAPAEPALSTEPQADEQWQPAVRSYPVRVVHATGDDEEMEPVQPTARFMPTTRQTLRPVYENVADPSSVAIQPQSGQRADVDEILRQDPRARQLTYRIVDGSMELSGQAPSPTAFYDLVDRLARLPGIRNVSFGRDFRFAN